MNKERIRLIYLTMLFISSVVFCFSLFCLLKNKKDKNYKLEDKKNDGIK